MPTGFRIGRVIPGLGMGCDVQGRSDRGRASAGGTSGKAFASGGGEKPDRGTWAARGLRIALAAKLVKLSEDERQKLAALSDAIEREVGFGWYLPEEAERA